MPVEARLLLGFACALLVAYALTPVAIRVAGRFEFYDVPVGYKAHGTPTPYLGGAAVMAAFLLALLASALSTDAARTVPLAAGVAVLWGLGTADDRRPLSPLARVIAEALLAAGLWALGYGWDIGLGAPVDLALSVAWIVLVTNAFNLFDNMDGAASTMGFVASAAVAVLGLVQGDAWLAATAGALAGACLGFLPHNMASPARIFLGDGGSMPLGFAVAAIAMTGASDTVAAWQALLVGLLIVGVPLLDTALVIVSRRRRGVSILTGGHDHLTFRTRRHLRTARLAVTVLGGAQALVAALALLSVENGSGFVVLAVLAYLVAAGSTIAILEAEERREADAEAVGTLAAAADGAAEPVVSGALPAPRHWRTDAPLLAIAVLAGGAGLSPFWFGFYDSSVWVPVGMVVISATAAALIARPPRLAWPAAVVAGAALLLALWTLASSRWAESAQQAVLSGNRALVLAAVLALALTLTGTQRRAVAMVAALGAGIAVVGGSVVFRLLDGSTSLFQGGRLNEPLGYVNAEGTIFVIAFWLAVALAERRRPLTAAAGAALAAAAGTLILLSQSRGAALALAASAAVVVVALPGRRRRLVLLVVLAAVVAAFSGPSRAIYGSLHGLAIDPGTVAPAGRALLAAAVCAGLAWGALAFAAARVAARGPVAAAGARRAVTAGLAAVACVALVAALVSAGRIDGFVSDQYDAFVDLSGPAPSAQGDVGQTRLLSGSGNRYDYWRVAVDVSGTHPLRGLGAGGFDVAYFRERRTTEDIRQPHSLELQVLSETGIVGVLLLLVVLGGAVAGVVRAGRTAGRSETGRVLVVAGTGGATAWLAHTSVDWMHLIPGVTAMALCLLAVVLRAPWSGDAPAVAVVARPAPARRRVALALGVGVAACIVVTGASLARQGLAEHDRGRAQAALSGGDPARALREADQALRLDPDDVSSYYAKASALARFGRGADARAVMVQAAAREPHDFVTWALLGDLDVRLGNRRQAAGDYGRAHRLNPRDAGLARLVADPRGALG